MGKDKGGFLTPKAIANRIKAKGLQKLRWYCQMCQKQCRDENGFKCHCMSDSHQRQMQLFSENSTTYMDEFSSQFEEGMMELIKRKAKSHRVAANTLYKEYIGFKEHTHMNSTIWETLTDFVMYLGRTGKCEVDETEKGWFVTYIDRDPETLAKMEARAKRERAALDSEEKHLRDIQRMVKASQAHAEETAAPTEVLRDESAEKISFGLQLGAKAKRPKLAEEAGEAAASGASAVGPSAGPSGGKAKMSSIEAIMQERQAQQEAAAAARSEEKQGSDHWLASDIVVKVVNKKLLGGKYYKVKGVVEKVVDKYTAHVRMSSDGALVKLDQDDLETVVPQVGSSVLLVNGRHRGEVAKLMSIDQDKFCVSVKLDNGRVLDGVEYEDVCKIAK
ncbi:hypothetical protein AB1Y20_022103 [Prymnesium parvum]|uniref:DNA/RNA-binding protein Kin17 WH-like domain-containing protein n=1 Tax=Prymnesium parvum TaxID=97485 RepID=A0AB34JGC7_PRYPA